MLLVATHTKTLLVYRWIDTTGEKRGLVLVREWDVPGWDRPSEEPWVYLNLCRATVFLPVPRGAIWHFHPVRAKTRGVELLDSENEKSPDRLEITTDRDRPKRKKKKTKRTKEVEEVFITNRKSRNQLALERINFLELPEHTWERAVQKKVSKGQGKTSVPQTITEDGESHELVYICGCISCVLTRLKPGLVPD